MRASPNVIVTGTPGVGKTTHCEELAKRTGLKHLSVNQVVKDRECHEGWDDEFQSWIVDEDKVGVVLPPSPSCLFKAIQIFHAYLREVLVSHSKEIVLRCPSTSCLTPSRMKLQREAT